ncbi:MAG: SDR family oxidoreductase, partial [Rhodospirillales bacterium]|nr:SDR family oxidoreductase [Rhodospirillales bacterium]
MLLKDKVCIIVGAGSLRGIGYATAELFAEQGAKVVLADLVMDEAMANSAGELISRKTSQISEVHGIKCDICEIADCDSLIEEVVARYGKIDVLVNSAGMVKSQSFLAIAEDDYDQILDVNLKGTFNLCRSVLRYFSKQNNGTIVNIASV